MDIRLTELHIVWKILEERSMFRCTLLLLTVALAAMAVLFTTGCGGNDAPAGPLIMAVIPSCGSFTLNHYADHFFGPTGKYNFALVAGTGSVIAGRGSPTEPNQVEYDFDIVQVTTITDAGPGSFIRSIAPDSAGLYDLSPSGSYMATVYKSDGLGADLMAKCYITSDSNFDAPGFHIESSPAIAGPWTQIWATDGVVTVPTGTYINVMVNSGVINTLNTLTVNSSVTGENTAYTEGTSVAWPAGDYRFNVVVAKNGRDYVLTLVLRVTPSQ